VRQWSLHAAVLRHGVAPQHPSKKLYVKTSTDMLAPIE